MVNTHAVASQSPTALPTPEVYWKYWEGQRKINGLLFTADKNLITAVDELKKVIAKILELNPGVTGLQVDFSAFDYAIKEAREYSEQVPAVNPPGCSTPPY